MKSFLRKQWGYSVRSQETQIFFCEIGPPPGKGFQRLYNLCFSYQKMMPKSGVPHIPRMGHRGVAEWGCIRFQQPGKWNVETFLGTQHDRAYNRKKRTFCHILLDVSLLLRSIPGPSPWIEMTAALATVFGQHVVSSPWQFCGPRARREAGWKTVWILLSPALVYPKTHRTCEGSNLEPRFPKRELPFVGEVCVVLHVV